MQKLRWKRQRQADGGRLLVLPRGVLPVVVAPPRMAVARGLKMEAALAG